MSTHETSFSWNSVFDWLRSVYDSGWLIFRVLFSRVRGLMSSTEKIVLNVGSGSDADPSSKHRPAEVVASDMQRFMLNLKGSFMQDDGRGVDYASIKRSDDFAEFREKCKELRGVDVSLLDEDNKKAFFLNVYNALTVHGLANMESLPSSVLEAQDFWSRTCYDIGGHVYSLDDIEHGILRANRPHPAKKQPCFAEDDPRLSLAMDKVDPRIHFALVCGAKSCPPINVYSAKNLNFGLEAATRNFCDGEVRVQDSKVSMSKIFLWYGCDFGESDAEKLRWCLPYLKEDNSAEVTRLLDAAGDGSLGFLSYHAYNWQLNGKADKES
ncbi:uncharacterized protein LOC135823229 [Sycon ciliatum]|uniref:uncharacterized protein LOC135823229 n=1 Tax=Sycon ciliatum TaxID=27933 RepID=UPI0031F675B6